MDVFIIYPSPLLSCHDKEHKNHTFVNTGLFNYIQQVGKNITIRCSIKRGHTLIKKIYRRVAIAHVSYQSPIISYEHSFNLTVFLTASKCFLSNTKNILTASISSSAFQCSFGAVIPDAVWIVRFKRLVQTRRLGICSFSTNLQRLFANCKSKWF